MKYWKRLLVTAAAGVALTGSAFQAPLEAQKRPREKEPARWSLPGRVIPKKYEEPAFARGYDAGRERGIADARKGERYDPVASSEYREGDRGYEASYGSRDAYKSNYRAGFRQGYEDGYRTSK